MPAEVETGAYNIERGVPWHGLGTSVEGYQTAAEILHVAELDWTVERRPVFLAMGNEVERYAAIVRNSDDKALGIVGSRYVPANNVEVLSFLDGIIGEGQAAYDSAWSLRGGRTVAISAELTRRVKVAQGEDIRTFLTATTAHDGKGQIRFIVSPVRVVCMNTLAMATSRAQFTWARKHTRNALSVESLGIAREALEMATAYQEFIEETAAQLISETFSGPEFERLAQRLVLNDADAALAASGIEIPGMAGKRLDGLLTVWSSSPNLEGIRATKWGALNAIAEWADYHDRYIGANAVDNRVQSVLAGRASDLKTRALQALQS